MSFLPYHIYQRDFNLARSQLYVTFWLQCKLQLLHTAHDYIMLQTDILSKTVVMTLFIFPFCFSFFFFLFSHLYSTVLYLTSIYISYWKGKQSHSPFLYRPILLERFTKIIWDIIWDTYRGKQSQLLPTALFQNDTSMYTTLLLTF